MNPRIAIVLTLALVAAGCMTSLEDQSTGPEADDVAADVPFVDPIVDQHDHGDASDHARSTASLGQVGYTPMGPDGRPYSYIGELDTHGDLAVVQVLGRGSVPGFVLLDISDPEAPEPIGRAEMPASYVVDVKFGPDGEHVFAASQNLVPLGSDAPEDPRLAGARAGIAIWNVQDPTAPELVSVTPVEPDGCHMLSVKRIRNATYVFCIYSTVTIFQAVANPVSGSLDLAPVSTYAPRADEGGDDASGSPSGAFPHDMTLQRDPLDPRRWLMSVSHWDLGVRVVDVTDPTMPRELGAWTGEGAQHYEGFVHSAMMTRIDGARVLVATPETLDDIVPAVWVLDASDLGDLKLLAEWTNPGAHSSQGLLHTTHQFQLVGDTMVLAYNHAGVWVLDLSSILAGEHLEGDAHPEVLGYHLPASPVEPYDPERAAVPNTWDVNVKRGLIYASDRYTGFYVLHFDGFTIGDEGASGFA